MNAPARSGRRLAVVALLSLPFGIYRTFSLDEDYSRYGSLRWYATGYEIAGYSGTPADSIFYFVRFAADEKGAEA